MLNENQEAFCILAVIVFWCLSFVSLIFLIPSVAIVFYACYEERKGEDSTHNDEIDPTKQE